MKESLVTKRFGMLVVRKKAGYHPTNNSIMYLCECDCGNMKEVAGTNLTSKHKPTKSCGCLSGRQNFQSVPLPTPNEIAERLRELRERLKLPTKEQIANDPELEGHWWTPIEA
ncbi:MAG: hypothetical protein M0R80_07560 [Proteobacteria bacterium]|jgi:hypothetical protein|nr:hypothetical protein [Pseudomonadota bacterium]